MEDAEDSQGRRFPPHLRLVWSRNEAPSVAPLSPSVPGSLAPCRPANLAVVIESHLTGADGLSDEVFLHVFSGRRAGR